MINTNNISNNIIEIINKKDFENIKKILKYLNSGITKNIDNLNNLNNPNNIIVYCLQIKYYEILNIFKDFTFSRTKNTVSEYIIKNNLQNCLNSLLEMYPNFFEGRNYHINYCIQFNKPDILDFLLSNKCYMPSINCIDFNENPHNLKKFYDILIKYNPKDYVNVFINNLILDTNKIYPCNINQLINMPNFTISNDLLSNIMKKTQFKDLIKLIKQKMDSKINNFIFLTMDNIDNFNNLIKNKDIIITFDRLDIRLMLCECINLNNIEGFKVLSKYHICYIDDVYFKDCIEKNYTKMFILMFDHNKHMLKKYDEILDMAKLFNNVEIIKCMEIPLIHQKINNEHYNIKINII